MTTPRVTELRPAAEPVSRDPFVDDLERAHRPSGQVLGALEGTARSAAPTGRG